MFAGVDVASLGISSIAFAIKRCFCVSSMAVFILLSCRSTKNHSLNNAHFSTFTRAHKILITVVIVEI